MVDFGKITLSGGDRDLLTKIATRAAILTGRDEIDIDMDLTVVHHYQPLRLADLFKADDFNFLHDVGGIGQNLNRETGEIENHFLPRFTKGV